MMTNDIRRSPPLSYVDLKDRNYTLFVVDDQEFVTDFVRWTLDTNEA